MQTLGLVSLVVKDYDEALAFYVGKLGMEVTSDQNLGFMRWLTVGVPGQPGRDILLEIPGPPSMDEATADQIRSEITRGASGFTVGFSTGDIQQMYETLLAKGFYAFDLTQDTAPLRDQHVLPVERIDIRRHHTIRRAGECAIQTIGENRLQYRPFKETILFAVRLIDFVAASPTLLLIGRRLSRILVFRQSDVIEGL